MLDWRELVKERLGPLGLGPKHEEEIVAELAEHLESMHEELCRQGFSIAEADERAWLGVPDWTALRQDIRLAVEGEDPMNRRSKSLWIPGLAALAVSSLWLWGVQLTGFQPYFFSGDSLSAAYWPWLVILPAIGAFGAWWSRRVGGRRWERLLVAVLPAVSIAAFMLLAFAVGLVVDGPKVTSHFFQIGWSFWAWAILPGLALSIGALPFLRNPSGGPRVSGRTLEVGRQSSSPGRKLTGLFCWSA